jgi:diacylglycerol kinase (ATP)
MLGVVPVGSGNDFAHSIGIPMKSDHALVHAFNGAPSSVDVGLMTDANGRREYFDNTAGIGFDTVVTIRSHRLPIVRGFLMYLTAVIQVIILDHHPAHMQIETDTEKWEQGTIMLTICNGPREGGGFMVAPDAKNTDGLLNYATVTECSRLTMFRLVPEVMNGTHGRFKQVKLGTCRKFALTADRPLYVHVDGEIYTSFGSNLRGLSFEILPGALQVVTGNK